MTDVSSSSTCTPTPHALATVDATSGLTRSDADTVPVFDLVADPLIVVSRHGVVVVANDAAMKAVPGLAVGAPIGSLAGHSEQFDQFLSRCLSTSEPVSGTVLVRMGDGEFKRLLCRGRRCSISSDTKSIAVLIHVHSTGVDRRFGLLTQRLLNARKVMDERRRRERELLTILQERDTLLARLEADAAARDRAERERDDTLARLYNAGQDERHRLARDLHDHAGQQVVAMNLSLNRLARHLVTQEAKDEHDRLLGQVQGIVDALRRVVLELRPPALDEFGFVTALRALVADWTERTKIAADTQVVGRERNLPNEIAITLYRIAQEAMTNVLKHAVGAESVAVILRFGKRGVTLTIHDDGNGFEIEEQTPRALSRCGGLGLVGMKERLLLVGGMLRLESGIGKGTTIAAHVDLMGGQGNG